MQKIEELIAALETADGPSRELDAQIWLLFTEGATRRTQHVVSATGAWAPYDIDETRDSTGRLIIGPAYTSSIDAAVALVGRALPDWRIENLCEWDAEILRDQGPWMCDLVQRRLEFFDRQSAKCSHAPTAALALIIALLKAKLSQEKNNADK
jgi:hypothetical protein